MSAWDVKDPVQGHPQSVHSLSTCFSCWATIYTSNLNQHNSIILVAQSGMILTLANGLAGLLEHPT